VHGTLIISIPAFILAKRKEITAIVIKYLTHYMQWKRFEKQWKVVHGTLIITISAFILAK